MIDNIELKKLERLAKIKFSLSERDAFLEKLRGVMNMIDDLKNFDCKEVEPLRSVCDAEQIMIEDKVTESNISDKLLNNIPKQGSSLAKKFKCFVVPKVID